MSDGGKQLGLFGQTPDQPVAAAAVSADLKALAGTLSTRQRFGTSSWSFPGWQGLVYDRRTTQSLLARHGLAAYAEHPLLRTVGVDRTFYAPIGARDFATYAAAVPDDFRFLVKACSVCTAHRNRRDDGSWQDNPGYLDASFATEQVVAPFVEGLGQKAGPLVFQFPPHGPRDPRAFADDLGAFLAALPRGPAYAVELRDQPLFTPEYIDALRAANAGHCLSLHPRMPPVNEQAAASAALDGPLVVRWMLKRGLGYRAAQERYSPFDQLVDPDPGSRADIAALCLDATRADRDVFVIVNNKAEGCAPQSVFALAQQIAAGRR